MTRHLIPFVAAAAAVLALSACETTPNESETITWNTPGQSEAAPGAPAPKAPSPPLTTPQGATATAAPPGPECREYHTTVTIDGKPQKAYGKACRQTDGTWKQMGAVSTTPPPQASPGEQAYPYGWYGYEYPDGPRYGPGYSVGVGVGSGSHGSGGFVGYGVGF